MTVSEIFNYAITCLKFTSPTPETDAEYLVCHVLQKPRSFLFSDARVHIAESLIAQLETLVQKRTAGQPVAYIIGQRGFFKHDFIVSDATLIPRPETELLVETALLMLDKNKSCKILDLGTGSGIIGISLALESAHWQITAADYSKDALEIAKKNAQHLGANNIDFVHSNWFDNIPAQEFDLIVSNPPYIDDTDPHLEQGDLRFEPRMALTSGKHGLDAISHIITIAPRYLAKSGYLMIEHGYQQSEKVSALLKQTHFQHVKTCLDLNGLPRVTMGQAQSFTNTES